ncbi:MAG: hypothetical protein J0M24_22735 [Verrucomicrobia bacterium]|nr:hypothetical protein [Verrucomicrobiota bacterium]
MIHALLSVAATTVDPVQLENAVHGALMREQGMFLTRVEQAQQNLATAWFEVTPALGTTAVLALVLFATAYLLRPVPAIILPAVGAFGVPTRRKRKVRAT